MTEEQKKEHEYCTVTGGFLLTKDYKEAFKDSYEAASQEDRAKILNCPNFNACLLYTSPSPRDLSTSRMPSSA